MSGREWGDFAGWMIASGVLSLAISRLMLWLASGLGDNRRRILIAHAVTLFAGVTLISYGLAFGAQPQPLRGLIMAAPPQVIWLVMDIVAQRRRERARREAARSDPGQEA